MSPALAGGFFFFFKSLSHQGDPVPLLFNLKSKIFNQEQSKIEAWCGLVAAYPLETHLVPGDPRPTLQSTYPGRLPGLLSIAACFALQVCGAMYVFCLDRHLPTFSPAAVVRPPVHPSDTLCM